MILMIRKMTTFEQIKIVQQSKDRDYHLAEKLRNSLVNLFISSNDDDRDSMGILSSNGGQPLFKKPPTVTKQIQMQKNQKAKIYYTQPQQNRKKYQVNPAYKPNM